MNLSKNGRRIFLILLVVIGFTSRFSDCTDRKEIISSTLDLVGTWILTSAEFVEDDVDLDGDGPMGPIKDIKFYLLDLLNFYASCSSIDEIPLQFSDELTSHATSADPINKYGAYAVCPEGQGVTSQIGEYYIKTNHSAAFFLEIEELNDPSNLIDWPGKFLIVITEDFIQDGVRIMHGRSQLVSNETSKINYFDFILEEYTGE